MVAAIVIGVLSFVVATAAAGMLMRRARPQAPLDEEIQRLNSVLARAERYKPENARTAIKF